jgi:choloylglycine hydrolase
MKKNINYYSFISIGQETDGMLGFFDGVNEKGFAAAVLYFEGYANYDLPIEDKERIASLDLLHYILGRCDSVDDLQALLENISIVGLADPVTQKAAPLHWIATDRNSKCVVIEQTKRGLEIITNPIGDVNPPGGFTSPERFVRTAFLKTHVEIPENRSEAIMECFHIMDSVFIPKGIVQTSRGTIDYTKYIAFMNTNTCEYCFNTYESNQIMTASLWDYNINGNQLLYLGSIVFPFNSG